MYKFPDKCEQASEARQLIKSKRDMLQVCKYSEPACITPTNPDLSDSFKQNVRLGIVSDTSAHVFHNMQKEISEVGPRIMDEFDFIEYDNAMRFYRKKQKEEEGEE